MRSNDVIVATFRFPIPAGMFDIIHKTAKQVYGDGLLVRQNGGIMEIVRPGRELENQ